MSNTMQIELIANPVSTVPTAKGSYQVIDLAYKNKSFQDKLEGKKVMSFTNKEVFAALQKAQFGDIFEISRVKNDKGFWDWTGVSSDGAPTNASSSVPTSNSPAASSVKQGTVVPKSNYETSEERAARQVMIVRQSSLSTSVAMLSAAADKKTPINPDTVISVAKQFEAYVFGKEQAPVTEEAPPGNFFEDMEDDLP